MRNFTPRKYLIVAFFIVTLTLCAAACTDDETAEHPDYRYAEGSQTPITFTLQLRQPSDRCTEDPNGTFPHSEIDGALIAEWEIPVFGNTVYESVTEYFKDRDESFTFRVAQHKFYMFHDCTLADGTVYDLETVYIAVDGKYAYCANYQSLLGEDGIPGTDDDVQTVVLVYRGWLY